MNECQCGEVLKEIRAEILKYEWLRKNTHSSGRVHIDKSVLGMIIGILSGVKPEGDCLESKKIQKIIEIIDPIERIDKLKKKKLKKILGQIKLIVREVKNC